MKRNLSVIAVLVFAVIVFFLQIKPAVPQDPPTKTPELMAKGKQLYEKNCVPCHGIQGDGKGPMAGLLDHKPHSFTGPLKEWEHSQGDPAKIFGIIKKGMPSSPMIAFDLPDEDIWAMVYRIMEFSEKR